MNKTEFVEAVAKKAGVSKAEAEKVLGAAKGVVVSTLKKDGDALKLTGFVTAVVKTRKARTGINPKDPSKKIKIPAKRYIHVKVSNAVKVK